MSVVATTDRLAHRHLTREVENSLESECAQMAQGSLELLVSATGPVAYVLAERMSAAVASFAAACVNLTNLEWPQLVSDR